MTKAKIEAKVIVLLLLIVSMLMLAGCQSKEFTLADKKGNMLYLTDGDIGGEDFPYGFYVLNDTGESRLFTPVMRDTPGYSGMENNEGTGRFFWWLDGKNKDGVMIEHEKLIPTVTKETPLVAIYSETGELPVTCTIEKYNKIGYTLGGKFFVGDDDQTVYFAPGDGTLEGSSFSRSSEGIESELTEVISINDTPATEYVGNIDTEVNILTGFDEKDYMKYFNIEFVLGTKTYVMSPIVDTMAFKAAGSMELSTPFTKTRNGYYIVNLPENLDDGYYYINDFGLFRYQGAQEKAQ